ncbi:MAG: T9SS type A sorting domain-containing protein [Cytophagaceae bacterium]|jgi:hypothetical protein|nr:T9SS type A sorting domain-containing protein [Cytophagaceae bacterium]
MKKILLQLYLIATLALSLSAQQLQWVKTLEDKISCSTLLPNGDVMALGNNSSGLFLTKIDSLGNVRWTKNFATSNANVNIASDENYNIYLCGNIISQSGSIDLDPGTGQSNYLFTGNSLFILKADTSGSAAWIKTYPRGSYTLLNQPSIAVSNSTGKIAVSGNFYSAIDFNPAVSSSGEYVSGSYGNRFVVLLDGNGNYINSAVPGIGSIDYTGSLSTLFGPSDAIYIGGYTYYNGSRFAVTKFNDQLQSLWTYESPLPVGYLDKAYAIDITSQGDVIAGGRMNDSTVMVKINQNTGAEIWKKKFNSVHYEVFINDLKVGNDDQIYIVGYLNKDADIDLSPDGIANGLLTAYTVERPFLARYSSNGEYISSRITTASSRTNTSPSNLKLNYRDSVFVVCGVKDNFGTIDFDSENQGDQNDGFNGNTGFVVKWTLRSLSPTTNTLKSSIAGSDFSFFPNPATTLLTLQTSTNSETNTIRIISMHGKIEIEERIMGTRWEKSIEMLAPGMYYIEFNSSVLGKFSKL